MRLVLLAAGAAAIALFSWQSSGPAPIASQKVDSGAISFRVRLGVRDRAPRPWDGSVSVTGGSLISLRTARPRPDESVDGNSWKLATRRAPNFVLREWEEPRLTDAPVWINQPSLIVTVTGTGAAAQFTTAQGNFTVRPQALQAGVPTEMLEGAVSVELVPTSWKTSAPGYENDFADVATAGTDVWTAWVGYRTQANVVFARRLSNGALTEPIAITEKPGDYYQVKASGGANGVWFVWAAQVSGNWDLYARRHDGRALGAVTRLTTAPDPDFHHQVARDSAGNVWVVWQGFRNGKSDILARRFDGKQWLAEERISPSPANDWEPAIAADGEGRVHVAWDTYDQGNYDVLLRTWQSGSWGAVQPVASTAKFEAHSTLACDRQGRLWAAWIESGFHWGKDTDFLVQKPATPLYDKRSIGLAVWQNGRWTEPPQGVEASLPAGLRGFNDNLQLRADPRGPVWLLFRHRFLRIPDTPPQTPAHRAAWEIYGTAWQGDQWSAPVPVPFSQGRTDMQSGFAVAADGTLWGAWPTDNRDYEAFLYRNSDVHLGALPPVAARASGAEFAARVIPKLSPFAVHPTEAEDLKRIRTYAITSGGRTYRIYRGDTHRHTEFSHDGHNDGSQQETYRYALDAAELDYLGVSDHGDLGGPDVEYIRWVQCQAVDLCTVNRRFVPVYTYERSLSYPNGHRNVIFAKRGIPTLPVPQLERQAKTGAQALYEYLRKNDGIAISHTSATGMGTDWRDNAPDVEPLVEIYQGDRTSYEHEGAPKAAYTGNGASAPGGFRPLGFAWNAWAKGYKLGVQASSDHFSTHISYACTLAEDFTREGLLDAMKKRHSYGATDNIVLDYRMETAGREYLQGDIAEQAAGIKLKVKLIGTRPFRQIDVIRSNRYIHTLHPQQADVSFEYVDSQPLSGESYYYVRALQVDEQIAWSSPIWVKR